MSFHVHIVKMFVSALFRRLFFFKKNEIHCFYCWISATNVIILRFSYLRLTRKWWYQDLSQCQVALLEPKFVHQRLKLIWNCLVLSFFRNMKTKFSCFRCQFQTKKMINLKSVGSTWIIWINDWLRGNNQKQFVGTVHIGYTTDNNNAMTHLVMIMFAVLADGTIV